MAHPIDVARAITHAFLAGPWLAEEMAARASRVLGADYPWLRTVAERTALSMRPTALAERIARFVSREKAFRKAWSKGKSRLTFAVRCPPIDPPAPVVAAFRFDRRELPELPTHADVAAWLGLRPTDLDWFAGLILRERKKNRGPLENYRTWVRTKKGGGPRVLEAPKHRLRRVQRWIHRDLLRLVPAHTAAHGFVRRRSAVTSASEHVGKAVVLRMDLADFFDSIPAGRVFATFMSIGYPEPTARLLTGLCTTVTPPDVLACLPRPAGARDQATLHRLIQKLRTRHLPQGAPTSPALANLCSYRLDARLDAIAAASGATYTRYADDLTFSGPETFARGVNRFIAAVTRIAKEEGFDVRTAKTRIMRRASRQLVTGIVVNDKVNLTRAEYDRLKAILHNCRKHGPESQNRAHHPAFREHLEGHIARFLHVSPQRGARLRAAFDLIDWSSYDEARPAEPEEP